MFGMAQWTREEIILVSVLGLMALVSVGISIFKVADNIWMDRRILAARGIEIADGITLYQGIQAYFGTKGFWGVDHGVVKVLAWSIPYYPRSDLRVYVKTKRIEVLTFQRGNSLPEEDRPEELMGCLIQAAKAQKSPPKA